MTKAAKRRSLAPTFEARYRRGMDIPQEVAAAARRIEGYVRRTPLERSPSLSAAGACEVFLKLENQQLTGSFKLRGAMNKLLSLDADVRQVLRLNQ